MVFVALSLLAAATVASAATTGSHAGDGTWYDVGPSACGPVNTPDQMVVAVPTTVFDGYPGAGANPNLNPICNQQIRAYYGDKSVDLTITDRCGGCKGFDLDLSRAAFDALAPDNERFAITWDWLTGVSSGVLEPTQPPATSATATTAPPATTTATGGGGEGEACSPEGAIRCPSPNTWDICGSGKWQNNGAVPAPYVCQDGALVIPSRRREEHKRHWSSRQL
ncbi:Non-catalytic module family EXPN protein [Schizophyllum commune]